MPPASITNLLQALRDGKFQRLQILDSSPGAIAMFDRDMRFLAANRQFVRGAGTCNQKRLGCCLYEVFPEISGRWKRICTHCYTGDSEQCDEDPFPRADQPQERLRWSVHGERPMVRSAESFCFRK